MACHVRMQAGSLNEKELSVPEVFLMQVNDFNHFSSLLAITMAVTAITRCIKICMCMLGAGTVYILPILYFSIYNVSPPFSTACWVSWNL